MGPHFAQLVATGFLMGYAVERDKSREVLDKTEELGEWRAKAAGHSEGDAQVDAIYAVFNDDYAGHARATANRMRALLGWEVEEGPPQQGRLFG